MKQTSFDARRSQRGQVLIGVTSQMKWSVLYIRQWETKKNACLLLCTIAGEVIKWAAGKFDSKLSAKHSYETQPVEGTVWEIRLARQLPNFHHRS